MSTKFRKFNFKKLNFPRKKDDAQQTNTAKKQISPERQKRIDFLNKYSLLFHLLLSCGLVFVIEWISRRSLVSACGFVGGHTLAYFYNAFFVYLEPITDTR